MEPITFQLPRWLPLLAGAVALAVLATAWWYRAQARATHLPGPWSATLIALRASAIAVLALALLRPSVPRPIDPADSGVVAVLVDSSRSMGMRDVGRSSGNLDLLEALGRQPAGAQPPDDSVSASGLRPAMGRLRDAQQSVAVALSELDYARLSGRQSVAVSAAARLRGAAEELRRAAEELSRRAAPLPQSRPLLDRCAELVRHVEVLPQAAGLDDAGASPAASNADASGSGWLRQGWDLVNRAGVAAEFVRGAAAEERLRDDAALRDASDQLARQSRLDLAMRAVTAPRTGLLAQLDPKTPVHAFTFANSIKPLAPPALSDRPSLAADGRASDLIGAVHEVRRRLVDQDVRAIVLFSDGRQNSTSMTPSPGAAALAPDGPPVFAVQCARGSPRDVAITRVSMPRSALAGETVSVQVHVRAVGPKPDAVEVRVEVDDGDTSTTRTIDLSSDDEGSAEIPIELAAGSPGAARRITVTVAPDPAELTADNNRVERWLKVVNAPLRVALVSGSAGWEYQYIRNALARRHRWVTLSESLLLSSGTPAGAESRWKLTPTQIDQQELVLMADVPPSAVSTEQWTALRRLVIDRGGGLILIAGDEHLPREWIGHREAAQLLPFAGAAPVQWKTWPGETPGFVVAPPPTGLGSPEADAVRLADDAAGGARRWNELPALWRYASVSPQRLKPSAAAMLVERGSGDPVLVGERVGLGRVMLMMTDETWRWRYKVGERDHDRLWLQLIRHAAPEPYALRASNSVEFDADRVAAWRGETIRVRARLAGKPAGAPQVHVTERDRIVRTEQLHPIEPGADAHAGHFETRISGLSAGEYRLKLEAVGAGREGDVSLPLRVYETEDGGEAELADVSGDDAGLRRLVAPTGGEMIRLDQIATLSERIDRAVLAAQREQLESEDAAGRLTPRRGHYRLWDSPYLFLIVLGLLGVEWAVRKRIGLA